VIVAQAQTVGDPQQAHGLINTDNRPALEKYNAKANKAWRTNYLRYYQGLNSPDN
jgi:hypothetical protein